jgi:hypothetical protein
MVPWSCYALIRNSGNCAMDLGTTIICVLIAVALTYLLVVMRLPPLYGPPEKNSTPKVEPPDDRKPSR